MEAAVKWSPKGRLLLAALVPVFAWLGWYSFTTTNHPSDVVGVLSVGATALALVLQLHLAIYRVEAGSQGIVERVFWRRREIAWADVQKVEAIGQAARGGTVQRWVVEPESAFHIVVHTRKGRVSVHRWMTGVDAFIEALRVPRGGVAYRERPTSALERDDPSVKSVLRTSPLVTAVRRTSGMLALVTTLLIVVPAFWVGGILFASVMGIGIFGNPILAGTLIALAPWGPAFGMYKWIERIRRIKFGPDRARPPLSTPDALFTVAAAAAGPALLYGFAPRAIATNSVGDIALCAIGLLFCWMPIAEVRRCLREA